MFILTEDVYTAQKMKFSIKISSFFVQWYGALSNIYDGTFAKMANNLSVLLSSEFSW